MSTNKQTTKAEETAKEENNKKTPEQINEALMEQINALTKKIADLETAKEEKNKGKELTVVREALPPLASIEFKVTNY